MKFCNIKEFSHYWQCTMTKMSFSNGVVSAVSSEIIFDSGTSYIIIPIKDFNLIKINVIDAINADCRFTPSLQLVCKCSSPDIFQNIKLILDNNSEFEVNFEDIIDYYPFLEFQCRFQLVLDIQYFTNVWIIGDSLLRNTLITLDMLNKRIGFLQNISLYQKNIVETSLTNDNDSSSGISYLYIILLAVIAILILFMIYKCFFTRTGLEQQQEMVAINHKFY